MRAHRAHHCPRCQIPLAELSSREVSSAICGRCRGVYLNAREAASTLGRDFELLSAAPTVPVAFEARVECPAACALMECRTLHHQTHAVTVDRCRVCKGLWLDSGEVQLIRRLAAEKRRDQRHGRAAKREQEAIDHARRQLLVDKTELASGDDEAVAKTGGVWWLFSLVTQLPLEGYRLPLWTWTIMAVCTLLFISPAFVGPELEAALVFRPRDLDTLPSGFFRMVTTSFLHGGWLHLLGNFYFLKVFGDNVEDRLGRLWFPVLYSGADLVGSVAWVLTTDSPDTAVVGASGAISGLIGAYLVFFPDVRISIAPQLFTLFRQIHIRALFYFPFWLMFQLFAAYLGGGGVAWWAHIGGFVGGFVLAGIAVWLIPDARVTALAAEFASGRREPPPELTPRA